MKPSRLKMVCMAAREWVRGEFRDEIVKVVQSERGPRTKQALIRAEIDLVALRAVTEDAKGTRRNSQ